MPEHILIGLGAIIVFGILAQWLAWRLHLPAILLLLVFGFVAGPVTNLLDPLEVFGDLFFPLVSVSVAIILFEGGLSLKLRELRLGGPIVARLTTIGIVVTWIFAALGAHWIAGMNWNLAILLGAVLVVTGPTVIIPLLRQVRPTGRIGSIVKWEGIVNDPIGAILAVLVFEVIMAGSGNISSVLAGSVLKALFLGTLFGLVGAGLTVLMIRRYLVPDFLQNPVSTMLVVIVFVVSNEIQNESGLLAVTVMGVALANQKFVSIKHIYEFKENLRVLLISSLFIMLAASLPVAELALTNWAEWGFIALLILVARPAAVFVATIGADISNSGRLFLSWLAPRGIVAAAVVSVFALRLAEANIEGVERLVPLTFKIIFATVAIYGLTLPFIARWLKMAKPDPQGVLFGGAQPWVQEVAKVLKAEGFSVALVDANWANVTHARREGLVAHYGSMLSEDLMTDMPMDDIGKFIAVTPNDEVNSLAALHFSEILSRSGVFQLPPSGQKKKNSRQSEMPQHLRGRHAFSERATCDYIREQFREGAVVKRTTISEEFDMDRFTVMYGEHALPLFVISGEGQLRVYTVNEPEEPRTGDKLISIVVPRDKSRRKKVHENPEEAPPTKENPPAEDGQIHETGENS